MQQKASLLDLLPPPVAATREPTSSNGMRTGRLRRLPRCVGHHGLRGILHCAQDSTSGRLRQRTLRVPHHCARCALDRRIGWIHGQVLRRTAGLDNHPTGLEHVTIATNALGLIKQRSN